jgi:hypothetical protein
MPGGVDPTNNNTSGPQLTGPEPETAHHGQHHYMCAPPSVQLKPGIKTAKQ